MTSSCHTQAHIATVDKLVTALQRCIVANNTETYKAHKVSSNTESEVPAVARWAVFTNTGNKGRCGVFAGKTV